MIINWYNDRVISNLQRFNDELNFNIFFRREKKRNKSGQIKMKQVLQKNQALQKKGKGNFEQMQAFFLLKNIFIFFLFN